MEQRRFLSGTAAIALVILTVSLAVTPGNAQIIQCFSGLNCGGTAISVDPGTDTEQIAECCLGDGITFQFGGEACRACIVYGWLDGPNFTGDETNEPYPLRIGFLKGRDFGVGPVLSYNVNVTAGTAAEGPNADFTVTNRNLLHRTTTATNPATSVILRVDELAQEIDETFQLTLLPNPAAPASEFSGTNEFLLDTITVTIIDQQRVTFSFPESDYSGPEPDEVITVRVRRNTRIANPVTLLIVPLNYTEFTDSGIDVPLDFPEVLPEPQPPLINFEPNRAKSFPLDRRDFNITPVEITFEADEINTILDVSVPITIFDDEINEVEEEIFVVVLQLVDATNSSTVDFSDATLCRITDNDPIFIGFERPEYRFNETETVFTLEDSPILIIKENGVVSEQIFRVSITAGAADLQGIGNALFQPITGGIVGDYSLGQDSQTLIDLFEAEVQARGFPFAILADELPEGPEAFGLTIATTSGDGGQFSVGTIGSTVVIIDDNDDVIVGFENSSVTVTENELRAELCVRVFVPADTEPLPFTFFLDPLTVAGTADASDYVALSAFGTNPLAVAQFGDSLRRFCFNVNITDDTLLELTESFNVTIALSFDSPMTGIIVDPSVAVITILDDDDVLIGFNPTDYTVSEDGGSVTFFIRKIGSNERDVTVFFSTADGSARDPGDYSAVVSQSVTFGPSDTLLSVTVPINDDSVYELDEMFTAVLTTTDPGVVLFNDTATATITDDDTVIIEFDPTSYTVVEGGVAMLRIVKVGDADYPVSVDLSTVDGSAVAGPGGDYTAIIAQVVTFGPTDTVQFVPVSTQSDSSVEGDEQFTAVLSNPSERVTLRNLTATVDIIETALVQVGFDPTAYTVNEDAGLVNLRIVKLTTAGIPVSVNLSTVDGSATAPSDYTSVVQQVVTFDPGVTELSVSVTIVDDDILENVEMFTATLVAQDPSVVEVVQGTANVSILDTDDVMIGFNPTDYTVSEDGGSVTFFIQKIGSNERDVTVFFSTVDGSATDPRDYSVVSQSVTFGPSDTLLSVTVPINDDSVYELDEMFTAVLTTTDPGVVLFNDTATATITDDDTVIIEFDPASYTVVEGGVAMLRIVKIGAADYPVSVDLSSVDGSAMAPDDYTEVVLTVTFAPGENEAFVPVPTRSDSIVEGTEQFVVLLMTVSPRVDLGAASRATVDITELPPEQPDVVTCTVSSPLTISPFSETNTYRFTGACEHILVSPCNESLLDFEIRVDFLSADLSNGRIGARYGDSLFIYTEDGTVLVMNANVTATVGDTTEYEGNVFVTSQTDVTTIDFRDFDISINITSSSFEVTHPITPGPVCGLCGNISGELIYSDGVRVAQIMDREQVEEFSASYVVDPIDQFLREEVRRACGMAGNDSVIGDPLMAVPFQKDQSSLCFEIHGVANQRFNLVSDTCTSVNAYYKPMNNPDNGNIISEIGVRAVGSSGQCINIRVYQQGSRCLYEVDGVPMTADRVVIDDVRVRRIRDDKIRIYVPNCEEFNLVMGVTCQVVEGQEMLRYDISRGLNLRPTSHGLLGQFWSIDLDYTIYTGPLPPELEPWRSYFRVVSVTPGDGSPQRSFIAEQYNQKWDRSEVTCFYAGNSQGGSLGEALDPNDPVIEGTYRDYRVAGLFEYEFTYSQFENNRCN